MPEKPVFKVTNKMFEMLSDWQTKLEDGTVEDPIAQSEESSKSVPPHNSGEKPESLEENQESDGCI